MGYLTKLLLSPLLLGEGRVGPEVAEKPDLCIEAQPQAQPLPLPPSPPAQLTSLLHLTSSSHFLLSSRQQPAGGPLPHYPPECVGGVTPSSPRLFRSAPVLWAPPTLPVGSPWAPVGWMAAGLGFRHGCDGSGPSRGTEARPPPVSRLPARKAVQDSSENYGLL